MGIVLGNNAHTLLSANISSTDTTIYVSDVSSFPTLGVGDYFYCTIESTTGTYEIVKVTQINAASFDVVRGQESTIAVPFNIGARVELRLTVQNLTDFLLTGSNVSDEAFGGTWDGDTEDAPSRNALYDKFTAVSALISANSALLVNLAAPISSVMADVIEAVTTTAAARAMGVPVILSNITSLRAQTWTSAEAPQIVFLLSNWTSQDGGGKFELTSDTTSSDNSGTIILTSTSGTALRYKRQFDGVVTPEMFGSSSDWVAAWNAAIAAIPSAGGVFRTRPGGDYSLSSGQVVCTGNNIDFQFYGSKIRPRYASAAAFKFGDGTTQVQNYSVRGGWFLYDSTASGGPTQALFDLRYLRGFRTQDCVANNLYQIATWGNTADSGQSYKWWNIDCEWNGRLNALGGHTDFIQCDGALGGYYHYGTDVEGDAANIAGEIVYMRFTSAQAASRFDHFDFGSGIVKGFDSLVKAVDARVVSIETSTSFRCDDIGTYAFRSDTSSGASKGGCEDINLHGKFSGIGTGGICYVSNASASIGCSDINISEASSNNCTGPVAVFEVTGSGTMHNVHVNDLSIGDYNPTDANQDVIQLLGDIKEYSVSDVHLDGKAGATYTARRLVYDNTPATNKGLIGPHLAGDVNTAVVTQTNAGTLVGRHCLVRADGSPVGAWSSATDRLFGRDTASAGPAEELTVGGGIEFTGSGGIQSSAFTGDVTKSAGGTATTIATGAVTYAKMQDVSATDKILGRVSSGSGDVEEITFTDQAQALADDTSFQAMCATLGTWYTIAQSAVAVSHTGDTSETTLATVTVPAGAMGANGRVRIRAIWSGTNSVNNKTLRHKFGGTNYFAQNLTTQQGWRHENEIANRNATNSQVGNQNNVFGSLSAAPLTSAIDTTASVTILLTGQLANSGETVTLDSYVVEVLYGA